LLGSVEVSADEWFAPFSLHSICAIIVAYPLSRMAALQEKAAISLNPPTFSPSPARFSVKAPFRRLCPTLQIAKLGAHLVPSTASAVAAVPTGFAWWRPGREDWEEGRQSEVLQEVRRRAGRAAFYKGKGRRRRWAAARRGVREGRRLKVTVGLASLATQLGRYPALAGKRL